MKLVKSLVVLASLMLADVLNAQLLEKNFLQGLEVDDKVLYRNIYQKKAGEKEKIGWGAFGYISVDIK